MSAPKVAKRYAQALFELAKDQGALDKAAAEINDLRETLTKSPELQGFLKDPVLTKDAKKEILGELFGKRLSPFVFNFLLFLIEKRRLNILGAILEVFDVLYLEHKNVAEVHITSAFPVEQGQVDAICKKLRDQFKKDIRPVVVVDPSLIGGIKVKTPELVYDFSYKTQLDKFRQSL
jgi:F-type H+-transporting ATPase subunit delta